MVNKFIENDKSMDIAIELVLIRVSEFIKNLLNQQFNQYKLNAQK